MDSPLFSLWDTTFQVCLRPRLNRACVGTADTDQDVSHSSWLHCGDLDSKGCKTYRKYNKALMQSSESVNCLLQVYSSVASFISFYTCSTALESSKLYFGELLSTVAELE